MSATYYEVKDLITKAQELLVEAYHRGSRTAHWTPGGRCTGCGYESDYHTPYCPYCGCRMTEGPAEK